MKALLAAALFAALALCSPASGSQRQYVSAVAFSVGAERVSVETHGTIPSRADVRAFVKFNGRDSQSCWADSPLEFECGWHGVLVTVTVRHHRGPAFVRATSVRPDVVRVYVRLVWP